MLTPAISVLSANVPEEEYFVPNDIDSNVGVISGDTLFYNIEQLVLPPSVEIENVTLPDFADNKIVIKVMYVDENYEFNSTHTGTKIWYSAGFMFGQDETFDLDFSLLDTNIVIPAGAATPSIVIEGNPYFSDFGGAPSLFFLNDDWAEHKIGLESLGFVVTDSATELTATLTNGTGTLEGTWRKSDGVLTDILFDDIVMGGMDLSDMTLELSLDSKENRPLGVSVGDSIEMLLETFDLDVTGSGDIYTSGINQTGLSEVQATMASLEGKTMLRFVVNEVYGMYYTCSIYAYDLDTDTLKKITDDDIYFNGFFGSIQVVEPPKFDSADHDFNPSGIGPVVSPDWDIYEGYMILSNTLLGVYINEILTIVDPPAEAIVLTTIEPTFGFQSKRGYYYFQQSMDIDIEGNLTSTSTMLGINAIYDTGVQGIVTEKAYLAYHESGVFAGMRMEATADVTLYDATSYTGFPAGNIHVEIDFKLRNPDYNPPDAYGGGFIPGFEWLIAIPALMSVAVISLIARKRK